jgi:ribokinase
MYDIITFGGAVVDTFVYTGIPERGNSMCYTVGTKIEVQDLAFSTGGGATNTATSFSRLGLKTGTIIKLGNDLNAKLILDILKKEKISFLGKQEEGLTDYSVILDSKEHNRTVLTYKEKSNSISFNELNLKKLKTKWFYFSAMDNKSLETQKKLAVWASRNGVNIAYNPSAYLTRRGPSCIKEILENTKILILNDEEARHLVPTGDLFGGLHRFGPEIVCITFGPKGNSVSDRKELFSSLPNNIKVKERTGAGDAFASGFVTGMIKFNDTKKAILMGSLNAESVIQKRGAKVGLLTWKEMGYQLSHNKVKIVEKAI